MQMGEILAYMKFLSTPSARRATSPLYLIRQQPYNFYPRPPRGGRRLYGEWRIPEFAFLSTPSARRATAELRPRNGQRQISIHALREEGDFSTSAAIRSA